MSKDKPVNRVHDHLNPSPLTRLLSIGRQLSRMCNGQYRLRRGCAAAKAVKSTTVNVVGVAVDRSDGNEMFFHVVAVDGSEALTSIASWQDFEESIDARSEPKER
jgi:hypothetical protein